jgi:hypothetical protein
MKIIVLSLIIVMSSFIEVLAQIAVINKKGTITSIDTTLWEKSGVNILNKNTGNVGVGNPSPTYKLDVTGKLRLTDSLVTNTARIISLNSGTINDSLVVADPATGVLKRISRTRLNIVDTANNGITKVFDTVQLGGILTKATTITTTATNTLSISGLSGGAPSDSLVSIVGSSGVLKRIEQNKPIVIKTTTTQANSTTTLTTINTLSFNTVAGKSYVVRLWLVYNSAATGTGIKLGPNAFAGGDFWYSVLVNNSATGSQHTSGFNTATVLNSTASASTTGNTARIEMNIDATSAATVSFQFASEVAGSAITIQPNSRLEYQVTN